MEPEGLNKPGLPPREHNARVPGHANSTVVWLGGIVAVFAVLGLVLFGTTRMNDTTASNPTLNTEAGTTTGAVPTTPSKRVQ